MARLSKRIVDDWLKAKNATAYLWDDGIAGFGVKRLPGKGIQRGTDDEEANEDTAPHKGRFLFKYRVGSGRAAPQRWLTLGTFGAITVEQARALAQQAAGRVANGEDPQGVKVEQRSAPTMSTLWQRFEAEYLPHRKPGTQREYRGQWTRHLESRFGNARVAALNRSAIDAWHKSLTGTPYHANRVLALLSRLMTLAEKWEWRPQGTNPCRYIERFAEEGRQRYLSKVELVKLGKALENAVDDGSMQPSAANAIRFLLLTGARLNEALTAEWGWVKVDQHVLELPDSKTGKKKIYLSDAALSVLDDQRTMANEILAKKLAEGEERKASKFIFPGRSEGKHMVNLMKPWKRICDQLGLTDVRLHDLRHTMASVAVGEGASLPVIGRLLGHTQAQTTQRYAHVDMDPALAAANAVAAKLGSIVGRRAPAENADVTDQKEGPVDNIDEPQVG